MKTAKRLLVLMLCAATLLWGTAALAAAAPEQDGSQRLEPPTLGNAWMAMLYEESTDTILFAHRENTVNPPASMTKVMTAVLVLEHNPDLSGSMTVPAEAISPEYCYWLEDNHLLEGEEISIHDLMKYLLIPSGNEAGTTLAVHVAGDIPTFIDMMNAKAQELGMTNTYYADPHGLSPDSKISSQDMITLCRYAMQFDLFREIVSTKAAAITTNYRTMRFGTTNRVMDPGYVVDYQTDFADDVIGIKTGFITPAGLNLATCMVHDDLTFYCVVMHGSYVPATNSYDGQVGGHHLDTIKLLKYARAFSKQGFGAGEAVTNVNMWGAFGKPFPAVAQEDVYILSQTGRNMTIAFDKVGTSVKQGDVIGTVTLADEFGNVRTTALLAGQDASMNLLLIGLIIGGGALLIAGAVVAIVLTARKRKAAQPQAAEEAPGAEA